MSYSFEELANKKVADLREIAKEIEHEALKGYSGMHKAELIKALCIALEIEDHKHHEVVGLDKASLKAKIQQLKTQRNAALEAHDAVQLRRVRRKIHRLKRTLRASTV